MDPIKPTQGPTGPVGPEPTKGPNRAQGAGGPFSLERTGAAGTGGEGVRLPGDVDRLRSVVMEGVRAGATREEIRQKLVERVASDVYGKDATPEMINSINAAMAADPQYSSLVMRLIQSMSRGE